MDDLFDILRVLIRYLGYFCQITLYWIKFICIGLETKSVKHTRLLEKN